MMLDRQDIDERSDGYSTGNYVAIRVFWDDYYNGFAVDAVDAEGNCSEFCRTHCDGIPMTLEVAQRIAATEFADDYALGALPITTTDDTNRGA